MRISIRERLGVSLTRRSSARTGFDRHWLRPNNLFAVRLPFGLTLCVYWPRRDRPVEPEGFGLTQ